MENTWASLSLSLYSFQYRKERKKERKRIRFVFGALDRTFTLPLRKAYADMGVWPYDQSTSCAHGKTHLTGAVLERVLTLNRLFGLKPGLDA